MALETGTYISDLNSANPTATDDVSEGDDHIRLLKSTILATFPNITGAVSAVQAQLDSPTMSAVQATTSGTEFDFTGIPSWVTKIDVMLYNVSITGLDNLLVQLGDSGGIENTGYVGTTALHVNASTPAISSSTAGFPIATKSASDVVSGVLSIVQVDSAAFTWVCSGSFRASALDTVNSGGHKALTGALTQIRLTRSASASFDGGSAVIRYS